MMFRIRGLCGLGEGERLLGQRGIPLDVRIFFLLFYYFPFTMEFRERVGFLPLSIKCMGCAA